MRLPVLALTAVLASMTVISCGAVVPGRAGPGQKLPGQVSPVSASLDPQVIVHLFEWPWDSVANECTNFLGPKGYDAVQVSPPQEHVELASKGYPWYQDYQPVSYQLRTRRGDRERFAS